jgi:hypothetical protein
MNALKHGRTSAAYKRLVEIISQDPEGLRILHCLAGAQDERKRRLRRQADRLLQQVLQRFEQQALDRANEAYENDRRIPGIPRTKSVLETRV